MKKKATKSNASLGKLEVIRAGTSYASGRSWLCGFFIWGGVIFVAGGLWQLVTFHWWEMLVSFGSAGISFALAGAVGAFFDLADCLVMREIRDRTHDAKAAHDAYRAAQGLDDGV